MGKNEENRVCFHEKMEFVKKKKIKKTIYYCPGEKDIVQNIYCVLIIIFKLVDCVYGEWSAWSECPECTGDMSGYTTDDLKDFEQMRQRRVKIKAKYRGKKCKRNIDVQYQQGKCTDIQSCPEEAGAAFVAQWNEWSKCFAPCGKQGRKVRKRKCIGEGCKDELEQFEDCPGFCPPQGWSEWEQWSNCPVTCGHAQRARRRHCRDDNKEEMKGKSTCKGIGRQTQRCDMGKCGSTIKEKYEGGGGDPVKKYEKEGDKAKKQKY